MKITPAGSVYHRTLLQIVQAPLYKIWYYTVFAMDAGLFVVAFFSG